MERKPYYRVREISSKSKIPASTLYDAVRNGEIEALKLGSAVYIPEHEARRLLGEPVSADDEHGGTDGK